jgi:uncharacterized protein
MTGRELAWRVLANEVLASSAEERGVGEKAPSYVISPLGGRMNRVVMAGSVTAVDRGDKEAPPGLIRARLTDPTGTVPLLASSYQPAGQLDLEAIWQPTHALVVGKVNLFQGSGSLPAASIRAEAVRPLPDTEYRTLSAEVATQTLERLELVVRLRSPASPSDAELTLAGASAAWVRGARASITRYPTLDPTPYFEALGAVLIALRAAPQTPSSTEGPQDEAPTPVVRVVHPRSPVPSSAAPAGLKAMEGRLLEILDELAEESPDGYADMDDLAQRAARHGLDSERMEELLNYLSENGTLEEPLVGKFRRAEGPPPG